VYPSDKGCGGVGLPLCNEAPHCAPGLYSIFPEGLCVSAPAEARNCGSLGNAPCSEGRKCHSGLTIRYAHESDRARTGAEVGEFSNSSGNLTHPQVGIPCREDENICAPSPIIPCGVRGLPVCVGGAELCQRLLSPAFPQMVCVDSPQSKGEEPCGILGRAACIDLECVAPLVVHPSTKVCVPPQGEPCGSKGQSQCFWDGTSPCEDGLAAEKGLCIG
jgi:hypothetical protein